MKTSAKQFWEALGIVAKKKKWFIRRNSSLIRCLNKKNQLVCPVVAVAQHFLPRNKEVQSLTCEALTAARLIGLPEKYTRKIMESADSIYSPANTRMRLLKTLVCRFLLSA